MLARRHARHLNLETIDTIRSAAGIFGYRVSLWNATNILRSERNRRQRKRTRKFLGIHAVWGDNVHQRRDRKRSIKRWEIVDL